MNLDDMATERRLDRECRAAAIWLLEAEAKLGWGSGNPVWDAIGRISSIAEELGYEPPPRPQQAKRRKTLSSGTARKVWDRDGWECCHCGSHRDLTVDHIVPVAKGGSDEMSNLQTLCKSCNSSKGARC